MGAALLGAILVNDDDKEDEFLTTPEELKSGNQQ
jgi:hypothetical protein